MMFATDNMCNLSETKASACLQEPAPGKRTYYPHIINYNQINIQLDLKLQLI
jgi:hypothetical protein